MKASKFSEAQMAFVLKQAADGSAVAEVCRRAGIGQRMYFTRGRISIGRRMRGLIPLEMN
jgi:putative transposase